jgi:hypothetical protein
MRVYEAKLVYEAIRIVDPTPNQGASRRPGPESKEPRHVSGRVRARRVSVRQRARQTLGGTLDSYRSPGSYRSQLSACGRISDQAA